MTWQGRRVTAASIRPFRPIPLASTHPGPMPVTCVFVCTSTPNFLSDSSAFAERSSGYVASTRGEPSSNTTRDFAGSMCLKSLRM